MIILMKWSFHFKGPLCEPNQSRPNCYSHFNPKNWQTHLSRIHSHQSFIDLEAKYLMAFFFHLNSTQSMNHIGGYICDYIKATGCVFDESIHVWYVQYSAPVMAHISYRTTGVTFVNTLSLSLCLSLSLSLSAHFI